jgi:hypothetical protein
VGVKKAVGRLVLALPAKVPDVEAERLAFLAGDVEIEGMDVNAPGALFFLRQRRRRVEELAAEAGLARPAFADEDELGFVDLVFAFFFKVFEVAEDGGVALLDDFD